MPTQSAVQPKPRKERKANADKRRQQLLDATLRSIAANGLTKTTLATVAAEAGLSQGVAVFYFKSKTGLLSAALREHYNRYEANWMKDISKAGDDPLEQMIALIHADFAPAVCNPEALSIWFAFWGEQKFTPQYAEICTEFDIRRAETIRKVCAGLLPESAQDRVGQIAEWIDTLTDGYWQGLHLFPNSMTPVDTAKTVLEMIATLLPEHARRIRKHL